MKGLKGLIIENEYNVPRELKDFIKDNPKLFSSVKEELFCKDRPFFEVAKAIPGNDALIVMSTWMYKDQLEQFVQALASGPLQSDKRKYFIYRVVARFNEWNKKNDSGQYEEEYYFSNLKVFLSNIMKLVKAGSVYTIEPDYTGDYKGERPPYIPKMVLYSLDCDVYHTEEEDPKTIKDDWK